MKAFYPDFRTKKLGILGYPLEQTLSPILHNEIYRKLGINALYQVFPVKNPEKQDLLSMQKMGITGLSVTIPYKEWAFSIADEHDASAIPMKSCNTLLLEKDRIIGYNTDGLGALESIRIADKKLLDSPKTGDILILGSGGSARGIGFAILYHWKEQNNPTLRKKIFLSARNFEKADKLLKDMNEYLPGSSYFIPLEEMQKSQPQFIDLVIHTTPMGMLGKEQTSLLPTSFFRSGMTLFDIVYNPLKTDLVRIAKKQGCKIIPGIDMLLYQGAEQVRLFTGSSTKPKLLGKIRKLLIKNLKNN